MKKNGKHVEDFITENRLPMSKSKKRKGKLWTHTHPNSTNRK